MSAKALLALVGSCVLVLGVGCGGGGGGGGEGAGEKAAETPAAQPAAGTEPAATSAGGAGVVKGMVKLEGAAPAQAKIKMDADPFCKAHHGANLPTAEGVVTNSDGTLRNVFVYVKEGLAGKTFTAPTDPVVIDQQGCTYHPHVMGIMVGQPLKILNSDATLHNIHSLPKNSPQFNLGMPTKGMEITKKFSAEEVMVRVKCDVHPWMESWVGVLSHPYYNVTGDGGTFEIKDLPEGTYTIEAWHEKFGTQTQSVTVKAGAPAEVTFTFQAAA
jgi:hypothetical protein